MKLATRCKHKDRKAFCADMCNYCYHMYGREKYAYKCEHTDKKAYALGLCINCYDKVRYQRKKLKKKQEADKAN